MDTATIAIGGDLWAVDVALTQAEQHQGLGGLVSLPTGHGMLFDFGADVPVTITTAPMLFNIDILFIDSTGEVIDVVDNVSPGYLITESTPVRYVLEVNGGEAAAVDIGDMADISAYQSGGTPSGSLGGIITAVTPIAFLGMAVAMMSGAMKSVNKPTDAAKSKKYLPEGAKYSRTGMMLLPEKAGPSHHSPNYPENISSASEAAQFIRHASKGIANVAVLAERGASDMSVKKCLEAEKVLRDTMDSTSSMMEKSSKAKHSAEIRREYGPDVDRYFNEVITLLGRASDGVRSKNVEKASDAFKIRSVSEKLSMMYDSALVDSYEKVSGVEVEHSSTNTGFWRCRAVFHDSEEIWESKVFADEGRARRYLEKTFLPMVNEYVQENRLKSADVMIVSATRD